MWVREFRHMLIQIMKPAFPFSLVFNLWPFFEFFLNTGGLGIHKTVDIIIPVCHDPERKLGRDKLLWDVNPKYNVLLFPTGRSSLFSALNCAFFQRSLIFMLLEFLLRWHVKCRFVTLKKIDNQD